VGHLPATTTGQSSNMSSANVVERATAFSLLSKEINQ
jgi:hypothetical protein